MDTYRRSNAPLNQSRYTTGSDNLNLSTSMAREKIEQDQARLMFYIKIVIVFIGLIILALALKAVFRSPCSAENSCQNVDSSSSFWDFDWNKLNPFHWLNLFKNWVLSWFGWDENSKNYSKLDVNYDMGSKSTSTEKETGQKVQEKYYANTAATADDDGDDEGGWASWFRFGCRNKGLIKDKLKGQKFSVKTAFPELPSVEAIKANPSRFKVSLHEVSSMSPSEIKSKYNPTRTIERLAELAEVKGLDPRVDLQRDAEKVKRAENVLDDKEHTDFLLNLNDIAGSYKNILAKRHMLAELQQRVKNHAKELNDCENFELDLTSQLDKERENEKTLKQQIRDYEAQEAELRSRIEDKEKSLTEADKQNRDKIIGLQSKEAELKAKIGRKPQTEAEIQKKLSRATDLESEILKLSNGSSNTQAEIARLRAKLADLESQKPSKEKDLRSLIEKLKIIQGKLNALISHRELIKLLQSMTPESNKEELANRLMTGTIEEEQALLEKLHNADFDSSEKEKLKKNIEYDQKAKQEIFKNIIELRKSIQNYTGGEIEIEKYHAQEKELNAQKKALEDFLNSINLQIAQISKDIERLLALSTGNDDKIVFWQKEVKEIRDWVGAKQLELQQLERELADIQNQIRLNQDEAQRYKKNIADRFGNLDNQRNELKNAIGLARSQLNDILPRITSLQNQLEKQKLDCSAIKAFYIKAAEMLPQIQTAYNEDKQVFGELKGKINKHIDPFTEL